jgi:hypothetical protein
VKEIRQLQNFEIGYKLMRTNDKPMIRAGIMIPVDEEFIILSITGAVNQQDNIEAIANKITNSIKVN